MSEAKNWPIKYARLKKYKICSKSARPAVITVVHDLNLFLDTQMVGVSQITYISSVSRRLWPVLDAKWFTVTQAFMASRFNLMQHTMPNNATGDSKVNFTLWRVHQTICWAVISFNQEREEAQRGDIRNDEKQCLFKCFWCTVLKLFCGFGCCSFWMPQLTFWMILFLSLC